MRTDDELRVLSVSQVGIAEEAETQSAFAFPAADIGTLSAVDTFNVSTTTTITLQTELPSDTDLDLFFGNRRGNIASITYPVYKVVTVPQTGPYTVTETGLVADQPVDAAVLSAVIPGNTYLEQGSASNAGEFAVSADTITFNAAEAGKSVAIYYKKTGALTDARGGSLSVDATALGSFEFYFKYALGIANVKNRWYPSVSKSGLGSLASDGDSISTDFIASVAAGFNFTYLEWNA